MENKKNDQKQLADIIASLTKEQGDRPFLLMITTPNEGSISVSNYKVGEDDGYKKLFGLAKSVLAHDQGALQVFHSAILSRLLEDDLFRARYFATFAEIVLKGISPDASKVDKSISHLFRDMFHRLSIVIGGFDSRDGDAASCEPTDQDVN